MRGNESSDASISGSLNLPLNAKNLWWHELYRPLCTNGLHCRLASEFGSFHDHYHVVLAYRFIIIEAHYCLLKMQARWSM